MGKAQKKTGKGRLDKYYKLAKEQGYRARSAFKLIQLNKKYSFLETAKCCIDLCAAPGGWLQVAAKYMPVNSIIVGVDLVPIKPLPRVTTFTADITTSTCRNLIRGELKDWKADVVLHDGAPNVGSAWVQDAYSQAELVLMSLKLAVDFLIKGGTFITKVFRSADYNSLMWVFSQLFAKVEATKPPSSRNVSAEIFVVCRGYLAPKFVDPKFLDPKYAFKEITLEPNASNSKNHAQANVFQPDKKRRKRDGYDDGDYTLFTSVSASDFINSADPISFLGSVNQIKFDSIQEKEWLQLEITSTDIVENCKDLKVLGKGDFKALMKWRSHLREYVGIEHPKKHVQVEPVEDDNADGKGGEDDEMGIQAELERLNVEDLARKKKARRKANERKRKAVQKMQLQMVAPMDIGVEQTDLSLREGQNELLDATNFNTSLPMDMDSDSDVANAPDLEIDGDNLEGIHSAIALDDELENLYNEYKRRRSEKDAKFKVKEMRKKNKLREEEWHGVGEASGSVTSESEDGGWDIVQEAKSRAYDSDSDESELGNEWPNKPGSKNDEVSEFMNGSQKTRQWFDQSLFMDLDREENMVETQVNMTNNLIVDKLPNDIDETSEWVADGSDEDVSKAAHIQKFGLHTPEAVTLAQALVNRRTTKIQLINDGFNRHNFNDKSDLPSWFLEDEAKHYKPNIPVTKEAIASLRAKQMALDARPIKKIAEAKARKKFKAAQQLRRAVKKADGINESADMNEREKAAQIQKLMAIGASRVSKRKRTEVKVVVAKGVHRGIKGRPKGVKGRYAMVDARMRKETRAIKRKEKASKKRR